MSLNSIVAKLQNFAAQVVQDVLTEGNEVGQKLLVVAKNAAVEAGDAIEHGFEDLVDKLGHTATKLVTDLFADDTLAGLAKANLAATQLTEHAALNGITIAEQDVTALIKNAYLAVKAEIGNRI